MFKIVVLTLFFSSTLIALTDQPNYSQQLSNNIPFPTVPVSIETNPVCMMQMENGAIINLSSMCGKVSHLDNMNNEAAQQRSRTLQQLRIVCRQPNLNAGMRQICKDSLLN